MEAEGGGSELRGRCDILKVVRLGHHKVDVDD